MRYAERAEAAGFSWAMISDHYHPWTDRQGQSRFVWGVIGGIAQATKRLRVGTGVTCPTMRIHPAIIAQASATAAASMPGRFFLGVGAGENLNEHILGLRWPPAEIRRAMLEEAVEVIRTLWKGGVQDHHGTYYTVENARIYTLPEEPPPIMVAAGGPKAAELAGRIGDGLVATDPDREIVKTFERAGGRKKPRHIEVTVCWGKDEARARKSAHEIWALSALPGSLYTEIAVPSQFEEALSLVTEDQVAEAVVCGPDPEAHRAAIRAAAEPGFDHVCVHQIGPDQEGFLRFYEREVLPKLYETGSRKSRAA